MYLLLAYNRRQIRLTSALMRAPRRAAALNSVALERAVRPGIHHHGVAGSMPFALMTFADSGVRRKSTSAFAAAASWALVMMAAEKTVVAWRSPGSGPTRSMPATDINSWMRCTPISALQFSTKTPTSEWVLGLWK